MDSSRPVTLSKDSEDEEFEESGREDVELALLCGGSAQNYRAEMDELRTTITKLQEEMTQKEKDLETKIKQMQMMSTTTSSTGSVSSISQQQQLLLPQRRPSESTDKLLPQDTFSFMMVASARSITFFFAITVFAFQLSTFLLVIIDLTRNGQGPGNPFGIPGDVSSQLRATQFIATLVAIVTQGDLMTAFGLFRDGYHPNLVKQFPRAYMWKYTFSLLARLSEGALGLVVSFLLIVTAEEVKELLLNFTAIEFVSNLDEVLFFLSRQGFLGKSCKRQATIIAEETYDAGIKKHSRVIKTILLLAISLALFLGWAIVIHNQVNGKYQCKTVQVQFGDEMVPSLGAFSGLYDMHSPPYRPFSEHRVEYLERQKEGTEGRYRGKFAYCSKFSAWTFRWETHDEDQTSDPCDWVAKSAPTETFDFSTTGSISWLVRDTRNKREVDLDTFHLMCFDCDDSDASEKCSGHGGCENAVCHCEDEWFGLRCEFALPCPTLSVDSLTENFLSTRDWESTYYRFQYDSQGIDSYHRPVYIHDKGVGNFDIIAYTGRRWALMSSSNQSMSSLANYFNYTFHAYTSNVQFSFLSEPADLGTPQDSVSPVGLNWFRTLPTQQGGAIGIPKPDAAISTELICVECDTENPCRYDGVCQNNACFCSPGASGALCEIAPTNNGYCNTFFNTPEFRDDGGDCCEYSCHSTEKFRCGFDQTDLAYIGYPNCTSAPNEWHPHGNRISGGAFEKTGTSVRFANDGRALAVAEQWKVRLFDVDGGSWVERSATSPKMPFEVKQVTISNGPQNLLNSRNSLVPLRMAVTGDSTSLFYCTIEACEVEQAFPSARGAVLSGEGSRLAYFKAENGTQSVHVLRIPPKGVYRSIEVLDSIPLGAINYCFTSEELKDRCGQPYLHYGQYGGEPAINSLAISGDGDILVVEVIYHFHMHPMATVDHHTTIFAFVWNGTSYVQDGTKLFERRVPLHLDSMYGEPHQKPIYSMSSNGRCIVAAISKCAYQTFRFDEDSRSWASFADPILQPMCNEDDYEYTDLDSEQYYLKSDIALSMATANDGTVAIARDSGNVTVLTWNGFVWRQVGASLRSGPAVSTALSPDGSMLAVGIPTGGNNNRGSTEVFSRLLKPPAGWETLRISVSPNSLGTHWILESNSSRTVLGRSSRSWKLLSFTDEITVPSDECLMLTVYPYELICEEYYDSYCRIPPPPPNPPRLDVYSSNGWSIAKDLTEVPSNRPENCNYQSYAPRQVLIGESCMSCTDNMQLVQIMVQTCHTIEWKLVDNAGYPVLSYQSPGLEEHCGYGCVGEVHWETACINPSRCYKFVLSEIPDSSRRKLLAASPLRSLDYYIFVDGKVHSQLAVVDETFGTSSFGNFTISQGIPDIEKSIGQCAS